MTAKSAQAETVTEPARSPRGPRRLTARRKLIVAAHDIMSRNGLEGSSLAEIIQEAGVGVGSFYRYFGSKEDLAKAVFADRAEEIGAALERVALDSTNIAAATCYAFRRLIQEVEQDRIWASFIVQIEPKLEMLDGLLRNHARAAMRDGVRSGLLKVHHLEAGITAIHALIIAIAKAMLKGALSPEEAHGCSLFALRMFGIPEEEAVRLSTISMPALCREVGQDPGTSSGDGATAA